MLLGMASSTTTIEAVYPVKEECETNQEYKIACDIAYRRRNVLRLSAQYLSEREIAAPDLSIDNSQGFSVSKDSDETESSVLILE
ncbi:MAG: hypothetical protein WBL67_08875 [Nitrososphaeraceae archaeon]